MNNLQIAIGRITRGIDWFKAFIVGRVQQVLGRKPKGPDEGSEDNVDSKAEAIEMNHLDTCPTFKVSDGIECPVEGRPSGFIVDGEICLNVPIAEGESDFENLSEDDEEDDEEDANNSEMTFEKYTQQITVNKLDNEIISLFVWCYSYLAVCPCRDT